MLLRFPGSYEGTVGRTRRALPMAASHRTATFAVVILLHFLSISFPSAAVVFNRSSRRPSALAGIEFPDHLGFNAAVAASQNPGCRFPPSAAAADVDLGSHRGDADEESEGEDGTELLPLASESPPSGALKLHLKHRSAVATVNGAAATQKPLKESLLDSAHRDLYRIHTLHRRITEKRNLNAQGHRAAQQPVGGRNQNNKHHHRHHDGRHPHRPIGPEDPAAKKLPLSGASPELAGRLVTTLESGVTLGSGEYLADVFIGTPPRHFSLILDTGSDLNWVQCLPCHDCFEQVGPHYDPSLSSSYRSVPSADARCRLVSSPNPPIPCHDASPCPYFYWYGDRSNTTGDLSLETFTVNLTGGPQAHRVENVIFGCGHWNRGLFHGAAGLLGLGRGPLSFSSQLRSLYGGVFSYCLVDRNSDLTVSSKLILGEDPTVLSHPQLNFTSFVAGKENAADTFYYVHVKGIMVGGELLDSIPPEAFELSPDGAGGTIVDSGTTLSYFADPAYKAIRMAFLEKVKGYPVVEDFPVLSPCYNVSGLEEVELPELAVVFADGAVWNFPAENYFIRLEPEGVVCLAMLGTPRSTLSILGNYQQQNFHVVYDAGRSRLGFAPARCAEV